MTRIPDRCSVLVPGTDVCLADRELPLSSCLHFLNIGLILVIFESPEISRVSKAKGHSTLAAQIVPQPDLLKLLGAHYLSMLL